MSERERECEGGHLLNHLVPIMNKSFFFQNSGNESGREGGEEGGEIEPRTSQDETMTGLRTHRQNVRKKKIMWRLIVAENNVLMIGP